MAANVRMEKCSNQAMQDRKLDDHMIKVRQIIILKL